MNLTVENMPGPSPEIRELQLQQRVCLERCYTSRYEGELAKMPFEVAKEAPSVKAAWAAYEETVRKLVALLGPDAHCNHVDPELWSVFSDIYKDDKGFRPTSHFSRTQVQAWLDALSTNL